MGDVERGGFIRVNGTCSVLQIHDIQLRAGNLKTRHFGGVSLLKSNIRLKVRIIRIFF